MDVGRARELLAESREWLFESVLQAGPLLPEAPPGFIDALTAAAEANLAGARG